MTKLDDNSQNDTKVRLVTVCPKCKQRSEDGKQYHLLNCPDLGFS